VLLTKEKFSEKSRASVSLSWRKIIVSKLCTRTERTEKNDDVTCKNKNAELKGRILPNVFLPDRHKTT
jgi:hypothetical protein